MTTSVQDRREFRRRRRSDFDRRRYDLDDAMQRATQGHSMANFPAIIAGFVARGIPAEDIHPRENVFTYQIWQRLGRQVRKGEHGVKITTMVPVTRRQVDPASGQERLTLVARRPVSATVFHISQTDLLASPGTDPATDPARVGITSVAAAMPAALAKPPPPPTATRPMSPEAQAIAQADFQQPRRPAWLDRFKARRLAAAAA